MYPYAHVHSHFLWPVESVVPELDLLLVSGVLECWKHLTGRFNIQLTGSQTSYITAEYPAPPNPRLLLSSLYPGFLPVLCPSLCSDLSIPLPSPLVLRSPPSLFELGGGCKLTAPQVCVSVLLLIAFDLNGLFFIWRLLPPQPPNHPLNLSCLWFGILPWR